MHKLRQCWESYLRVPLDASARQTKLRELEKFLAVALRKTALPDSLPQFCDMRSVSNILAGEFLMDIHRICSESQDEDVAALQAYLLSGRGGVILKVLNTIGVQGLSCTKELGDLLVSLLPLSIKFPKPPDPHLHQDVDFAPMEACFSHLQSAYISTHQRKIKYPSLTELPCKNRTSSYPSVLPPRHKSRHTSLQVPPSVTLHRRSSARHGPARRGSKDYSTHSDSDSEIPLPVTLTSLNSPRSIRTVTTPFLQGAIEPMGVFPGIMKASLGKNGEGEEVDSDWDDDDDDEAGLSRAPLHSMDMALLLLSLLKDLCYDDHAHTTSNKSFSMALLPQLTQLAQNLHSQMETLSRGGHLETDMVGPGWNHTDFHTLLRYTVRVVVTLAAQTAIQNNGILFLHNSNTVQTLLDISWQVIQGVDHAVLVASDSLPVTMEKLLLIHDILHGCWLLLECIFVNIPLNPSILNSALRLFNDLLYSHGLELIKSLLLCFEQILLEAVVDEDNPSGNSFQAKDNIWTLVSSIGRVVTCLKKAKVDYIHMVKCTKSRHHRCDYSHFHHHHHDILGVAFQGSSGAVDCYDSLEGLHLDGDSLSDHGFCVVSVISEFLLQLYSKALCKVLQVRVLACVEESGVCCCMAPGFVLHKLLDKLDTQSSAMRSYILSVLVRCVLEQLGGAGADWQLQCGECAAGWIASAKDACMVCQDIGCVTKCSHHQQIDNCRQRTIIRQETSDSALSGSDLSLADENSSVKAVPRWRCLELFLPMLLSDVDDSRQQVVQHVMRLVTQGSNSLKRELFFSIFLPILQATKQQYSSTIPPFHDNSAPREDKPAPSSDWGGLSEFVISHTISALPVVLQSSATCDMFLNMGGIQPLTTLLQVSSLRPCVLKLFHVLCLVEERRRSTSKSSHPSMPLITVNDEESSLLDTNRNTMDSDFTQPSVISQFTHTFYAHLGLLEADCLEYETHSCTIEASRVDHTLLSLTSKSDLLSQWCDLWVTCDEMFAQSKKFGYKFLSTNGFAVCHKTCIFSLQQVVACSGDGVSPNVLYTKEYSNRLTCWTALFQSTLRLVLACVSSPLYHCTENANVTVSDLMDAVKAVVLESELLRGENSGVLKCICDILLVAATHHKTAGDVLHQHTFAVMHLRGDEPIYDRELQELSEASSRDTEACYTEQGYEADSEVTDFPEDGKAGQKNRRNVTRKNVIKPLHYDIQHPEVCRLVVEFIVAYRKKHKADHDLSSFIPHLLLRLISFAKQSHECAERLNQQHLIHILLEGLKTSLASDTQADQVESRLLLDLFEALSAQSFSPSELGEFLALFKADQCPIENLLGALLAMSESSPIQPIFALKFPIVNVSLVTDFELSVRSLSDDILTASLKPVVASTADVTKLSLTQPYSDTLSAQTLSSGLVLDETMATVDSAGSFEAQCVTSNGNQSSVGLASLRILLRDSMVWPTNQKGFSFSVWLMLDKMKVPGVREGLVNSPQKSGLPSKLRESLKRNLDNRTWTNNCLHVFSLGNQDLLFEMWIEPEMRNLVLRLVTHNKGEERVLNEVSMSSHLVTDKWQHLSVAFREKAQGHRSLATISTIVDGCHQKETSLEYSQNHINSSVPCKDSHLYLGHTVTLDHPHSASYQLGNIMLFKDAKMTKHTSFHLYSQGPDCRSLSQCDSNEMPAEYAFYISEDLVIHAGLSQDVFTGNHTIYLQHLRENLVLTFSPANPNIFSVYNQPSPFKPTQKSSTAQSKVFEPLVHHPKDVPAQQLCDVAPLVNKSLTSAINDIGGISVFMFLFAKIVGMSSEERHQGAALKLLLSLVAHEPRHARDMRHMGGYAMVAKVLHSPRCVLGHQILKVLLDAALTEPILLRYKSPSRQTYLPSSLPTPEDDPTMYYLNKDSCGLLNNVHIITDIILAWRIWQHAKAGVFELSFKALEFLVSDSHPHSKFNTRQLHNAGVLKILLNICLERIQDGCPSLPVSICRSLVTVCSKLVGSPPELHSVIQVCDVLLLMHPAASAYVSHSREYLYFSHKWVQKVPSLQRRQSSRKSLDVASLASPASDPGGSSPTSPIGLPTKGYSTPKKEKISSEQRAPCRTDGKATCEDFDVSVDYLTDSLRRSVSEPSNNSWWRQLSTHKAQLKTEEAEPHLPRAGSLPDMKTHSKYISPVELLNLNGTAGGSAQLSKGLEKDTDVLQAEDNVCQSQMKCLHKINDLSETVRKELGGGIQPASLCVGTPPGEGKLDNQWDNKADSHGDKVNGYCSQSDENGNCNTGAPKIDSCHDDDVTTIGDSSTSTHQTVLFCESQDRSTAADAGVSQFDAGHLSTRETWVMYPSPDSVPGVDVNMATGSTGEELDGEGLVEVVVGLLHLLDSVLVQASSSELPTLHGIVLKWQRLVVMANHPAAAVRAAVVRLLDVYIHKASDEQQKSMEDGLCWHLLAVQLHRHPTTSLIVDACLTLLLGTPHTLGQASVDVPGELSGLQQQSVVLLMALVHHSLHDTALAHNLLSTLHQVFVQVPSVCVSMLQHGVMEMLCSAVYELNASEARITDLGEDERAILVEDIQTLIHTVSVKCINTSGAPWWQQWEESFFLLSVLKNRHEQLYGFDSEEVDLVNSLCCLMLQSALDALVNRLEAPASLQQRTSASISSAVGSLWTLSSRISLPLGLTQTDEATSAPPSASEQDTPSTFLTPLTKRLLKSTPTNGSSVASNKNSDNSILPSIQRSISATIDECSHRLGLKTEAESAQQDNDVNGKPAHLSNIVVFTSGLLGSNANVKKEGLSTQGELLDRLKKIVNMAADFIILSGRCWRPSVDDMELGSCDEENEVMEETALARTLFQFILKSLVVGMERSFFQKRTLSATILWQAKDTFKGIFGRLLVHMLGEKVNPRDRLHIVEILAKEPKCKEVLNLTMRHQRLGQKVVFNLYFLLSLFNMKMTQSQRDEVYEIMELLQEIGFKPVRLGMYLGSQLLQQMQQERKSWEESVSADKTKNMKTTAPIKLRVQRRLDRLSQATTESAMMVTQQVNNSQSQQRHTFLDHIKRQMSGGLHSKKLWQQLIQQLSHERAVWYCEKSHPRSWQLDPTEGPSRMRCRLQRAHLSIDPRFLTEEHRGKLDAEKYDPPLAYLFEDDSLGSDSAALIYKLHTTQNIQYTCMCTNVTPSTETAGALLIGQSDLYFVADEAIKDANYTQVLLGNRDLLFMTFVQDEIKELHKRWYQLKDQAIEIFLTNGKTCLLAFHSAKDRDELFTILVGLDLPNRILSENRAAVQQLWLDGYMTNFDYLMYLNKVSGRTFNDLMQYPVFPFVLGQYKESRLDLNDPMVYRNLSKPISVQHKDREGKYLENYKWLELEQKRAACEGEYVSEPYHYGSHYSNSGSVLHFLVRLPPFTQMFLHYQDQNFDIPDRTFNSFQNSWHLASYLSTTDVKELIPEMFYLPEFFYNNEGFDFGVRQTKERVWDVKLPAWCHDNPRLFTSIHRQALESDFVTTHLAAWIDLVFGVKQKGQAAIDAINVFHPATYFGVDVDAIEDPVRRKALRTMIKTYGQTPKQLFKVPHPSPRPVSKTNDKSRSSVKQVSALSSLTGLRWGNYVGSPDQPDPVATWCKDMGTMVASLVCLPTGEVFGLGANSCLLVIYSKEKGLTSVNNIDVLWAAIVNWGHPDNVIRVKNRKDGPDVNFIHWQFPDQITCCASVPDCRLLFFGGTSGNITVYHTKFNTSKLSHMQVFGQPLQLYGHTASVVSLVTCKPYSILVSASRDHTCIIWDLNRLTYVRSITSHSHPIHTVAVSDTSANIASVSHTETGSVLSLHTVNAHHVATVNCDNLIHSLAFSNAPEGRSINVVAGGLSCGIIRLWSTLDLSPVTDIISSNPHSPWISLSFSPDSKRLFASNEKGKVVAWEIHSSSKGREVSFISFL